MLPMENSSVPTVQQQLFQKTSSIIYSVLGTLWVLCPTYILELTMNMQEITTVLPGNGREAAGKSYVRRQVMQLWNPIPSIYLTQLIAQCTAARDFSLICRLFFRRSVALSIIFVTHYVQRIEITAMINRDNGRALFKLSATCMKKTSQEVLAIFSRGRFHRLFSFGVAIAESTFDTRSQNFTTNRQFLPQMW